MHETKLTKWANNTIIFALVTLGVTLYPVMFADVMMIPFDIMYLYIPLCGCVMSSVVIIASILVKLRARKTPETEEEALRFKPSTKSTLSLIIGIICLFTCSFVLLAYHDFAQNRQPGRTTAHVIQEY